MTDFSALMCHAPIVVPAVGRDEIRRCLSTTRAMREVADRVVRRKPDALVLLSPHSPRLERSWSAWRGRIRGDLAAFRAPQVAVDLPGADDVVDALGLPEVPRRVPLDHGAMVPLSFLWDAGWRGPTAVLSPPWSEEGSVALGRALRELPGDIAVVASGDMSHSLKPGAPSGYHPDAAKFDRAFVAALQQHDWDAAVAAPYREIAHEDVVTTAAAAMSAAGKPLNDEVISYEGPWGVGYTEAIFRDPEPPLYTVARQAVAAALAGRPYAPPAGGPPARGVFVTLTTGGELRGCIGHIAPVHDRMYAEVADVARAAATQDPRVRPPTLDELPVLDIEVSVLSAPEPVDGPHQLDPRRYGVIVQRGMRRGLLLPDLDGVDTVEQQVAIARRKAGIAPGEPVELFRFTTRTEHRP